ncbi:subunit F of V-type ATPase [Ordospora colligata]|uniref:Subunit F of V-type ATPase n=1 Tax=Ordospora colligata OC4 TaxID=1354746 RepID=A0A0B2ULJ7_9MICR|nr:subunit F of V-type ATPase [Ordospora colligata OC4]KHN70154.1 subunit F of V-type ATPase [Ordospora colligata OC4]TBU16536.1 subunit F of V-type ATPase [Ordospora colligata]TBU19150.1 subunit F of V-type ATPase [Ordospora colligata]
MDRRTRIGMIGDEETLLGFLIAGIESTNETPNLVYVTHDTSEDDLRKNFRALTSREDLAMILICDFVAEKIEDDISRYKETIPAILIIPSKCKRS